jgi:hypothetical protein
MNTKETRYRRAEKERLNSYPYAGTNRIRFIGSTTQGISGFHHPLGRHFVTRAIV